MKKKQNTLPTPIRLAPVAAGFTLASILALAPVHALEFELMDGEVTGALDTTISYGALWRVQGQDRNNDDINGNDGNRNFDTGLVSQVYKITSDLSLEYENYGAFVRGTAYYDTEFWGSNNYGKESWQGSQPSQAGMNGTRPDNRFLDDAKSISGKNAEILDAYVYGSWDIGEMPLDVRFGKQVLSWGEGLFYRNGINTTNPLDAAKFRLPGSELKEALVPVETLAMSLGLTDNLSMEAFYQFNYRRTEIDPVGTFFSETDLFAEGGHTAYNDFAGTALAAGIDAYAASAAAIGGLAPAIGITGNTEVYADTDISKVASIGGDINPSDDGQFGVSFRYIAENLNDTEFGFYFINYHSKEPTIYADLNDDFEGVDIASLAALNPGSGPIGVVGAAGLATVELLGNVNANRQYAEDIRVYGFSFNTTVGDTSFSGEVAYRPNMPIGIATTNDLLGDLVQQGSDLADNSGTDGDGVITVAGQTIDRNGAVENFERVESWNLSLLAIHNFGPSLSFDSLFGVVEVASEHLRGSDLSYTAFNGDERMFAGRGDCSYSDECTDNDQITANAWGYSAVLAGTWNDVYAGVNLNPYLRWSQDIDGTSHRTGNFLEGRNAMTVGMDAVYLNNLEVGVQYTEFTGNGSNSMRDRDNIGINVKYSF